MNLPNMKRPCKDCPFRKDSLKGWLGKERMASILDGSSFTCHKKSDKQCAGHMLIKGSENEFVRLASKYEFDTGLSGRELVFETKQECIEHHETLNLGGFDIPLIEVNSNEPYTYKSMWRTSMTLSQDAHHVASGLFLSGRNESTTFGGKRKIDERYQKAIDELVDEGYLTKESLSGGAIKYSPTEEMKVSQFDEQTYDTGLAM